MPICWYLFFNAFFVGRNQGSFLQTKRIFKCLLTLRRNNITCHTCHTTRHLHHIFFNSTFKWNGTRHKYHTFFFLIYIIFLKKYSVTCVTCIPVFSLKIWYAKTCDVSVMCCVMCVICWFSDVKVFFGGEKHLELTITQISESGFSFSQASYWYCYTARWSCKPVLPVSAKKKDYSTEIWRINIIFL